MEHQRYFWQRRDETGKQYDEYICFRFDDDPEFMMGLSEREFLTFVLGGFVFGALIGLFLWYIGFYLLILKPYGYLKSIHFTVSIIVFCFVGGFLMHKKALRYVASAKRGKPRGFLFHSFAEKLNRVLGWGIKHNKFEGSWEIRR